MYVAQPLLDMPDRRRKGIGLFHIFAIAAFRLRLLVFGVESLREEDTRELENLKSYTQIVVLLLLFAVSCVVCVILYMDSVSQADFRIRRQHRPRHRTHRSSHHQ